MKKKEIEERVDKLNKSLLEMANKVLERFEHIEDVLAQVEKDVRELQERK